MTWHGIGSLNDHLAEMEEEMRNRQAQGDHGRYLVSEIIDFRTRERHEVFSREDLLPSADDPMRGCAEEMERAMQRLLAEKIGRG